ncbi:putative GTP pyrophosphokinase [Prauserella marina]|uniref:Putative GTP pyrophosphokinase n=2 Tax=Prauserella marina TaxID=530584 RepID=A0A1G6KJ72_9PSEU|nr:putative GTP pyrophosphokinase [Prauserella marina]SDC31162.1 putative GTP pyrophosphokinase [Prauserella marina]
MQNWSFNDGVARLSRRSPVTGEVAGERTGSELEFVRELGGLLLMHKFAVDELLTKLRIWSEEFDYAHEHDPIEHIASRIKRPESIMQKLRRKGLPVTLASARDHLTDIAGVRVVCPFVSDVYLIRDLIRRNGMEIVQTKDYIAEPKPNGYRSLHLLIRVPVHLSDRVEKVTAEIQLRTIAMDFWAAVERKIFDKSGGAPRPEFSGELKAAADAAADLDARMKGLHELKALAREVVPDGIEGLGGEELPAR